MCHEKRWQFLFLSRNISVLKVFSLEISNTENHYARSSYCVAFTERLLNLVSWLLYGFFNAFENEYWLYETPDQSHFWLKVKRSAQKHCDYFSFISTPDNICCYIFFNFISWLTIIYLFIFSLNSDFFLILIILHEYDIINANFYFCTC